MIRMFNHVFVVKNRTFLIHNLLDEVSVVVEVQACNKGNFLLSPSIDSIAVCMFRV